MKHRATQTRANKRERLTTRQVKKQAKIGDRWRKMVDEFMKLSLDELAEIKTKKRSKTDEHAYKTVVVSKEKDAIQ